MTNTHGVLLVAAENGTFPGGKVGGIGDVIRDIAPALAKVGCRVQVVTPTFADVTNRANGSPQFEVDVPFRGRSERLRLLEINADGTPEGVRHWVADHASFTANPGIYSDDPPATPFATDATKFALFCAAVGKAIVDGCFEYVDVLHLHDWHAAWLLLLRQFDPQCESLRSLRTVYTIHNLALQGVRPFADHWSSLHAWFPELEIDPEVLRDSRWPDCVNPTAAAIRLADAVHTVSPTYAQEILHPSAVVERGYYGGEGLEQDLRQAADQGRLHGILNGCEYPAGGSAVSTVDRQQILPLAESELLRWVATRSSVASTHLIAQTRLRQWSERGLTGMLLTSVSRVTGQKVSLLQQSVGDGRTALDAMLESLGDQGLFLFLGSGSTELELFLAKTSAIHLNFIFLNGFSEQMADAMYALGDLFVMPSSFEPCGIGQMLAMRSGQPCLVHGVGGLRDTVSDEINGFVFTGKNLQEQAGNLVKRFDEAINARRQRPEAWQDLLRAAESARFPWEESVSEYCTRLYSPAPA